MKAISQPVKFYPMQGSICFDQGWKLTSKITRGGVRCASRAAGQPESHCSLMRSQTGHGKSWAWISSTSKASVTFLSVIMFSCKTSWGSLKDCLIDLFSNEGFPKKIISDNGSPFNSQEFADYLSSHGVKHTTSSPHYPQSNGFIERHIQTVKNLLYKAMDTGTHFRKFSLS